MVLTLLTIAAMPWLEGFEAAAVSDRPNREVVDELAAWRSPDDRCVAAAYGGFELDVDVAPAAGAERVLVSFTQGMIVLDRDGEVIARAPGFTCQGSADEIEAVAAGDAWIGSPVIALAATAGGRAERTTWLTLYRVGETGDVEPVWTGEVERHAGHATQTGGITVYPGGLVYRAPGGATSVWRFDRDARRYLERGAVGPTV